MGALITGKGAAGPQSRAPAVRLFVISQDNAQLSVGMRMAETPGTERQAGPIGPDERETMLAELYDELRAAASRLLRREAPFLTLEPTELVNDAALRVMKLDRMSWNDRQHFFATGARILRQAMMDAIRRRKSEKGARPPSCWQAATVRISTSKRSTPR